MLCLSGLRLKSIYLGAIWVFPKINGTSLGVPIIRTIVYWGLYWATLIWGSYHMSGLYHVANLATLCVITIAAPPAVMAFTTPLECESQCNTIPTHIEPYQCDNY